jgi:DNA helicase IV
LEFDLVLLVDPDEFGTGIEGVVDRYVATTRATQQLVVLKRA